MKNIITKYRVEEHWDNSETYALHGTYKTFKSALNKMHKVIQKLGADTKAHIYIIQQIVTTERYIICWNKKEFL